MGVHDGHRQRLREQFLLNELESFNDITALEFLLSFAIPRKDTNELAHALLDKFGSLKDVMSASHQELLEVKGIGENAAVLLRLVPQMYKKSAVSAAKELKVLRYISDIAEYLYPRFLNEADEVMYLLCIDNNSNPICCIQLARGVADYVETNIRKIAQLSLSNRATRVVIAHNHPRGPALPSIEDDEVTRRVLHGLSALGVSLSDHLIFFGEEYYSYVQSGRLGLM